MVEHSSEWSSVLFWQFGPSPPCPPRVHLKSFMWWILSVLTRFSLAFSSDVWTQMKGKNGGGLGARLMIHVYIIIKPALSRMWEIWWLRYIWGDIFSSLLITRWKRASIHPMHCEILKQSIRVCMYTYTWALAVCTIDCYMWKHEQHNICKLL